MDTESVLGIFFMNMITNTEVISMFTKRDDDQFEMGNPLENDEAGRETAAAGLGAGAGAPVEWRNLFVVCVAREYF